MTIKLPIKLYTNIRVVLTVGSYGFARISETTSDLSLVFASDETHENKTDLFQNFREYINVF